jgi:hypothetical protein
MGEPEGLQKQDRRHQNYKFKQSNETRKVVSTRNLSGPESSVPTLANHKLTAESVPALYGSFNTVSTSKTDILLEKHFYKCT